MNEMIVLLTALPKQRYAARAVAQLAINRFGTRAAEEMERYLSDPIMRDVRRQTILALREIKKQRDSRIFITVA
ncbi:hypothetical protein [Sphingomonas sp. CROZ-RG-20F-R02-07]|uniref:hypothetical protein n=1 Tax=Sphingomonas sp. CROZ-RG-20F-R02-07 TaxID=2914832 RepID=UPI001F5ACB97|nr:hypothetical protein [Sphingomonas sp. CROZ-RG-20F-R02-07]